MRKYIKKAAVILGLTALVSTPVLASGPTAPDLTAISGYVDVLVPAIIALGGTILTVALGWMGFKFAARQGISFFKSMGSK